MAKGSSGIIWLGTGLFFGVVTLAVVGVGGYFTWHCHNKLQIAQKVDVDEDVERKALAKKLNLTPDDTKRFQELNSDTRRNKTTDDVNDWMRKRQYSFAALFAGIIPLLISLRCLFTGGMRLLKKNNDDEDDDRPRKKKKKVVDEDDEEEEEERPVKKKKKKVVDDEEE